MSDPASGDLPTSIEHPKSAPEDRATAGPFDESEASPVRPYVDLGAIKFVPRPELGVRLEVEESNKRVIAVSLDYAGSTLQVQAFAAPRSSGLWHEIREQITQQVQKQGGTVAEGAGPFGPELRAELPAGGEGRQLVRFVGVDGPRWFLRGMIAGQGAVDAVAAAKVEDLFRSVVVVRGSTPMPPRDLIPLHVPASVQNGPRQDGQLGQAPNGQAPSGQAPNGQASLGGPSAAV